MKTILLLTGVLALLSTTGCLVSEGGWHGHRGRMHHSETVIVAPPVLVPVPVVIVHPH